MTGRATFPAAAVATRVELMTVRRPRTSWPGHCDCAHGDHDCLPRRGMSCHPTPRRGQCSHQWYRPLLRRLLHLGPRRRFFRTLQMIRRPIAPGNPIDHVIAISIDGLNPAAITKLGEVPHARIPPADARGFLHCDARTVREKTSTLPNHTTMLTGRPSTRGAEAMDTPRTSTTVAPSIAQQNITLPASSTWSTITAVQRPVFAAKTRFKIYQRTWNSHGARDLVGANDGRAKIDRFTIDRNNARRVAKLTAELRRKPRELTFVHLSLPDRVGHARGFA